MTWQLWLLLVVIVLLMLLQYSLAWSAIVDLLHRPSVRGNSHTFWMLLIIGVPIVGPIIYGAMGPTSLRSAHLLSAPGEDDRTEASTPPASTSIQKSPPHERGLIDRMPVQRPGLTRSRAHNPAGSGTRRRRLEE